MVSPGAASSAASWPAMVWPIALWPIALWPVALWPIAPRPIIWLIVWSAVAGSDAAWCDAVWGSAAEAGATARLITGATPGMAEPVMMLARAGRGAGWDGGAADRVRSGVGVIRRPALLAAGQTLGREKGLLGGFGGSAGIHISRADVLQRITNSCARPYDRAFTVKMAAELARSKAFQRPGKRGNAFAPSGIMWKLCASSVHSTTSGPP